MKVGYVGLIGRPNAGKSTLLNKVLGEKVAIISDKPQTTRTSILGIKTTEKGQIIFLDNPGIHKPLHRLNKRMMNFVFSSYQTSDILCLLIDTTLRFGHGDQFVLDTLKDIKIPVILLINKVDIIKKDKILPLIEKYNELYPFKEIIPISALKGINVDVLEDKIYENLPEAEKVYSDNEVSIQSQKFLFSEIIREKVLHRVREELPFATAAFIDEIEDRPKDKDGREVKYIQARIFVERDNQRKIIIGRHGSLIKRIGTEARKEIEVILDAKVYLDLQVRVKDNWRDSPNVLDLIENQ